MSRTAINGGKETSLMHEQETCVNISGFKMAKDSLTIRGYMVVIFSALPPPILDADNSKHIERCRNNA